MTYRPSSVTRCHRLPDADPARIGWACSSSAQHTTAIMPNYAALSGSSNEFTLALRSMHTFRHTPEAAVAPNRLRTFSIN